MRPPSLRVLALVSVLSALGASAGCGGSDSPSVFPQHQDIPVGPAPTASQAKAAPEPKVEAPPPPPAPKEDPSHPAAVALTVTPEASAIVAAADRSDADKALDAGRHPGELLTFLGLAPGMHVAELVAGTGYTTELLARAVAGSASKGSSANKGKVWAENPPGFLKFVGAAYKDRLAKPVMKDVIRADREVVSPFPADAKNLDAVVCVLNYHDTVWLNVDRGKMNKAVFDALKKGGEYVIVDHSAAPGHGLDDVKTLHRIEEATVASEVTKAGFEAAGTANFLRNPEDARDWNDSPTEAAEKRGTSDRFVLKFVKP
jgi:predicted methyltransferase